METITNTNKCRLCGYARPIVVAKQCKDCGKLKPLADFYFKGKAPLVKEVAYDVAYRAECKLCTKARYPSKKRKLKDTVWT